MVKRVGIKDVAKEAGVSIATVSYVINNKGGQTLSEETKEKVWKAVNDLGYVPNLSARILANNKSNLIGVVIPQTEKDKEFMFSNPFYSEFLSSLEYTARKKGYHVLISGTNADENYVEVAKKRNLDGIVILGVYPKDTLEEIQNSKIPTVIIDSYVKSYHFNTVGTDDCYAGYTATKYLLDKGHRKIALVTGSTEETGVNQERLRGYQDALMEYGIAFDKRDVLNGTVDFEYGEEAAKLIAKRREEITAVFCSADILALGVLKGLSSQGIRVPEEISVLGFDNTFISKISTPALSTIDQNISLKGERAAKMIIGILEGNLKGKQDYIVPIEIVERDSIREV
ncbi:MAG: LacI family transcriptional regulator [Clostridiales bacterium]|nr:LacI family transcriptional regulator [Clostridiales bacterium]